jgi:hypothetical protein
MQITFLLSGPPSSYLCQDVTVVEKAGFEYGGAALRLTRMFGDGDRSSPVMSALALATATPHARLSSAGAAAVSRDAWSMPMAISSVDKIRQSHSSAGGWLNPCLRFANESRK